MRLKPEVVGEAETMTDGVAQAVGPVDVRGAHDAVHAKLLRIHQASSIIQAWFFGPLNLLFHLPFLHLQ